MRAYSLVAVLAATVLLLVGLLPLLQIQGRLYRQARESSHTAMLQSLERDFRKISHQSRPQSTSWTVQGYDMVRKIKKLSSHRYRVIYQASLTRNPKRTWQFTREWYRHR